MSCNKFEIYLNSGFKKKLIAEVLNPSLKKKLTIKILKKIENNIAN